MLKIHKGRYIFKEKFQLFIRNLALNCIAKITLNFYLILKVVNINLKLIFYVKNRKFSITYSIMALVSVIVQTSLMLKMRVYISLLGVFPSFSLFFFYNEKARVAARFLNFFPGFPNLFQVLKSTHFWVYIQFKVKFKVRNCVKQYKNIEKIL